MKILIHIHSEFVGGSNQCLKGIPCPDDLAAQQSEARKQLEAALATGLDPAHLIEFEYRLALDEAEQHYVERLLDRIINDLDFGRQWRAHHRDQKERKT